MKYSPRPEPPVLPAVPQRKEQRADTSPGPPSAHQPRARHSPAGEDIARSPARPLAGPPAKPAPRSPERSRVRGARCSLSAPLSPGGGGVPHVGCRRCYVPRTGGSEQGRGGGYPGAGLWSAEVAEGDTWDLFWRRGGGFWFSCPSHWVLVLAGRDVRCCRLCRASTERKHTGPGLGPDKQFISGASYSILS